LRAASLEGTSSGVHGMSLPWSETLNAAISIDPVDLALSMNGKRGSTTKVQQACAAALAWKELFPEGAPKSGRPKKGEKLTPKSGTFLQFAKSRLVGS